MIEPLELLFGKYGFEIDRIKKIGTGIKYTAIMLTNGNIGVCANLGYAVNTKKHHYSDLDLTNFSHRIVLNSYYTALLNYSVEYKIGDIFETINFHKFNNITMIGLFKPIVEIFQRNNIPLKVFDYRKSDNILTVMSKQNQILQ